MNERPLTGKRRLFVEAYLGKANCNKTEAARLAGYASPGQEGHRVYKDPAVQAAISERMKEWALGPEEILHRLTEQARGDMGDFVAVDDDGGFRIDLAAAERSGRLRLVKKIGYDPRGRPCVELYDSQAALLALSKRWALLPDRQEVTGADGGPVRVGISHAEALSELRSPVVAPELPEGTRQALLEGEELEGPEASGFGAIGL